MNDVLDVIRQRPEIALFLALALGHLLGKLQIKQFALGSITGVLLAGVLIGQLHIPLSPQLESIFLKLFLFAIGYSAGPRFIESMKGDGIAMVLFASVQCILSIACVYALAHFLGFDAGKAAGLLSGSQTASAALGTAAEAVQQLAIPLSEKTAMAHAIPVAYAVTYLFGTIGSAWILVWLGPRLLRIDLKAACREYEARHGGAAPDSTALTPDAHSDVTNLLVLGLCMGLGGLLGSITLHMGSAPVSISPSGGILLSGLLYGWYTSRRRTSRPIPRAALWLLDNLGLGLFIAAVGINAGPDFVSGLKQAGPALFFAGVIATTLPLLAGLFIGRYIFKFDPVINIGACAGAQGTPAALRMIEETTGSRAILAGYVVTYPVATILLTISGLVIVAWMS
jgi:AspT/YidE/YbjL antiporter-like protein